MEKIIKASGEDGNQQEQQDETEESACKGAHDFPGAGDDEVAEMSLRGSDGNGDVDNLGNSAPPS